MFFFVVVFAGGLLFVGPSAVYLKALDGIIRRERVNGMKLHSTELAHFKLEALEKATEEIRSFGFVVAGDYVAFRVEGAPNFASESLTVPSNTPQSELPPPAPVNSGGFMRVFLHKEKRCVMKLMVVVITRANGEPLSRIGNHALISYADVSNDGMPWSYATSNIDSKPTASAIKVLLRRPRVLSTRVPGMPFSELWRLHLSRREEVATVAGLSWNPATLQEALEAEALAMQNIRDCFKKMTPFKMAWLLWQLKREPNTNEWLGELRGKLPPLSP